MSLKRLCRTHLSWIVTVWIVTHLQIYSRTCFGLTNANLWYKQPKTGSVRAVEPSQLLLGLWPVMHDIFAFSYIAQVALERIYPRLTWNLSPCRILLSAGIWAMEHTSSFKICIFLLLNSGLVRALCTTSQIKKWKPFSWLGPLG